jgi:hypothetical protein
MLSLEAKNQGQTQAHTFSALPECLTHSFVSTSKSKQSPAVHFAGIWIKGITYPVGLTIESGIWEHSVNYFFCQPAVLQISSVCEPDRR